MFLRFVNCDDSDGNIDECYYEARAGCNKINKHARVQCLSGKHFFRHYLIYIIVVRS